jgi:hypothetical protein
MFREQSSEDNTDLDKVGPARFGEHPTDDETLLWSVRELQRWYAANNRALGRRRERAIERCR